MPVFPPPPIVVRLDGHPLLTYRPAILVANTVMVPVSPFASRIAHVVQCSRSRVVLERGRVRQEFPLSGSGGVSRFRFALALRAFGYTVRYDAPLRTLWVNSPPVAPIAVATPFAGQLAPPRVIFTPTPVETPRPPFTGPMRPRRTPIPIEFWATPQPSPNPRDGR